MGHTAKIKIKIRCGFKKEPAIRVAFEVPSAVLGLISVDYIKSLKPWRSGRVIFRLETVESLQDNSLDV